VTLLETYGKEIVAAIIPFIIWALTTFFRTKAKLLLANPHSFTFLIQHPLLDQQGNQIAPAQTVRTSSFILWNAGRETATKIEWVFNWKPIVNIWPARHFTENTEPDGRYVMFFDSLAPGETLGCELLSINWDLPNLVTVRCDQCVAQNIKMYPQPVVPAWQRRISTTLRLAGLALIIYATIAILQLLVLKTPAL